MIKSAALTPIQIKSRAWTATFLCGRSCWLSQAGGGARSSRLAREGARDSRRGRLLFARPAIIRERVPVTNWAPFKRLMRARLRVRLGGDSSCSGMMLMLLLMLLLVSVLLLLLSLVPLPFCASAWPGPKETSDAQLESSDGSLLRAGPDLHVPTLSGRRAHQRASCATSPDLFFRGLTITITTIIMIIIMIIIAVTIVVTIVVIIAVVVVLLAWSVVLVRSAPAAFGPPLSQLARLRLNM